MKRFKSVQSRSILNTSVTTYGRNKIRIISDDLNWFGVQDNKKGLFSDSDDEDNSVNCSIDANLEEWKVHRHKINKRLFSDSDESVSITPTYIKTSTSKRRQNQKARKKTLKRNHKKGKQISSEDETKASKTSLACRAKRSKTQKRASDDESSTSLSSKTNEDIYSSQDRQLNSDNKKENSGFFSSENSRILIKPCIVDLSNDKVSPSFQIPLTSQQKTFASLLKPCSVVLSRDDLSIKSSTDENKALSRFDKEQSLIANNDPEIVRSRIRFPLQTSQSHIKPNHKTNDNLSAMTSSRSFFKSQHHPSLMVLHSSKKGHITNRRKRTNYKITNGASTFSFSEQYGANNHSNDLFQNSIIHGNHESMFNVGSMLLQSFCQNKSPHADKFLIQSTPMTRNTKSIFQAGVSPLSIVDTNVYNHEASSLLCIPSDLTGFFGTPKQNQTHDSLLEIFSSSSISNTRENVSLLCVDKVLSECNQTAFSTFENLKYDQDTCVKLGEGVFGEVYKCTSVNNQELAVKIVPVNGAEKVNNEKQKTFSEILPEIINSRELSTLVGCPRSSTDAFINLYNVHCVSGEYPDFFLKAWDNFNSTKGSENERPDFLSNGQNYIVFEYSNGGISVEHFQFRNAAQALSVLRQTIAGLAVAEENFRFEHRDLHWGNILVEGTRDKHVEFTLAGVRKQMETIGVKVKIIDFTFSRMTKGGLTLYQDLSSDPDLFTGDPNVDYQFQIYRMMQEVNNNDWSSYKPKTNVLWIHYLIHKFLNKVKFKSTKTKIHSNSLKKLKLFDKSVLDFQSCCDVVRNSSLFCK